MAHDESPNKRIEHDFGLAAPLRSAANPKRLIRDVRLCDEKNGMDQLLNWKKLEATTIK